jgi:hypothetical protein
MMGMRLSFGIQRSELGVRRFPKLFLNTQRCPSNIQRPMGSR